MPGWPRGNHSIPAPPGAPRPRRRPGRTTTRPGRSAPHREQRAAPPGRGIRGRWRSASRMCARSGSEGSGAPGRAAGPRSSARPNRRARAERARCTVRPRATTTESSRARRRGRARGEATGGAGLAPLPQGNLRGRRWRQLMPHTAAAAAPPASNGRVFPGRRGRAQPRGAGRRSQGGISSSSTRTSASCCSRETCSAAAVRRWPAGRRPRSSRPSSGRRSRRATPRRSRARRSRSLTRPTGGSASYRVQLTPIHFGGPGVTAVLALFQDVTTSRDAAAALEASEERMRSCRAARRARNLGDGGRDREPPTLRRA